MSRAPHARMFQNQPDLTAEDRVDLLKQLLSSPHRPPSLASKIDWIAIGAVLLCLTFLVAVCRSLLNALAL